MIYQFYNKLSNSGSVGLARPKTQNTDLIPIQKFAKNMNNRL